VLEKVLFYGVPDHENIGDLSTGPGTGKVWIVRVIYAANTNSESKKLTLKHYIDSDNVITLIPDEEIQGNERISIGPVVIEHGQKIQAEQETEGAVEVIAYGLEADI
jgi:hypothetical protein